MHRFVYRLFLSTPRLCSLLDEGVMLQSRRFLVSKENPVNLTQRGRHCLIVHTFIGSFLIRSSCGLKCRKQSCLFVRVYHQARRKRPQYTQTPRDFQGTLKGRRRISPNTQLMIMRTIADRCHPYMACESYTAWFDSEAGIQGPTVNK